MALRFALVVLAVLAVAQGYGTHKPACIDLLADVDGDGKGDTMWHDARGRWYTCGTYKLYGMCSEYGMRRAWPPASPLTARQACCACGGGRPVPVPLEVQLGPRPMWLVSDLEEGHLKETLDACSEGPFEKSDFSIGHRGAPMQFPEHTKESYIAAARMGAGILECDVTFTKDKELVCRHAQCDLHQTTDILLTPLAAKCREPFTPASDGKSANAKCCTSDITLAEFRTLKGKMDGFDQTATTVEQYVRGGTAGWRTTLYESRGTLMTHRESIELFKKLDAKMTPELKAPEVTMPFDGFTQEDYARKMMKDYEEAGVDAADVFLQSFQLDDVLFWIRENPRFGRQAVFLDARPYEDSKYTPTQEDMDKMYRAGVRYLAPPMYVLMGLDEGADKATGGLSSKLIESPYTIMAKRAGLKLITWTLERSGPLGGGGGWYYSTVSAAVKKDSDMLVVLDFLARRVGVKGVFTDWPATVTYYANCMGL